MRIKRTVCLSLALLMLAAAALVSCSVGTEEDDEPLFPGETRDPGTAAAAPLPTEEPADRDTVHDLPADLDFEGASFRMASSGMWSCLVNYEDTKGEVLSDAQYDVKRYAEELLGVEVAEENILSATAGGAAVTYALSGDTAIQVYNLLDRDAFSSMLKNIYYPYGSLKYIDLSKKYWYSDIADKLSVGDYQFMALGSVQLNSFRNVACLFMNQAVAEDYGLALPFDDVTAGTWTFDKLKAYQGTVRKDVDGDGEISEEDTNTFGSTEAMQNVVNTLSAADVHFIGKGEDGSPALLAYGNEKLIDAMEYCRKLFFDPTDCPWHDSKSTSQNSIPMFVHDRELFMTAKIGDMANERMREMESVYAVLPYPKWDEAQENYISRTFDSIYHMTFKTAPDPDMVSAVLEAMNARAYEELIPALIETSLQYKYNNDPRNVANIRICFDTRCVEMSDFMTCSLFGDTPTWKRMYQTAVTPASWLASVQVAAETVIGTAVENLKTLAQSLQ
jgi:hypothetical protein